MMPAYLRSIDVAKYAGANYRYWLQILTPIAILISSAWVVRLAGDQRIVLLLLLTFPVLLASLLFVRQKYIILGGYFIVLAIILAFNSARLASIDHLGVLIALLVISFVAVLLASSRLDTLEKLAYSEERYRILALHSSDIVIEIDDQAVILWISISVKDILGWDVAECTGRSFLNFIHPDDRPCLALYFEGNKLATNIIETLRVMCSNGKSCRMAAKLKPSYDKNGVRLRFVGGLKDIHLEIEATNRVEAEKARSSITLNSMLDPHVIADPVLDQAAKIIDFIYVEANQAACVHNKISREQLIGARLLDLLPDHAASGLFKMYVNVIETGNPLALDDYVHHHEAHGQSLHLDIRAVKVGESLSCTWRDVTERYLTISRLAASELNYRLLAENSTNVVARIDDEYRFSWVSPSLFRIFGWHPDEWVGHATSKFIQSGDLEAALDARKVLSTGKSISSRIRMLGKTGEFHWVQIQSRPFINENGEIEGHIAAFNIIDDQVAAEEELSRQAQTDPLTGFLNRKTALERIDMLHAKIPRTGTATAVLFCDIDKFKFINDSYGHLVGDKVISHLCDRIRSSLRSDDFAARYGGDELLVVLYGVQDLENAIQIAEKLRLTCRQPINLTVASITASLSIGVTILIEGESTDSLVFRADQAMYMAKRAGRDQVFSI